MNIEEKVEEYRRNEKNRKVIKKVLIRDKNWNKI